MNIGFNVASRKLLFGQSDLLRETMLVLFIYIDQLIHTHGMDYYFKQTKDMYTNMVIEVEAIVWPARIFSSLAKINIIQLGIPGHITRILRTS